MNRLAGPLCLENWRASESGVEYDSISEYPIFSDASAISGQIDSGLGPYKLLNTIRSGRDISSPAIVLRIEHYWSFDGASPSRTKTDVSRYHGGSLSDEIAALLSLCLGIRAKAGGENRCFRRGFDPLGEPLLLGYGKNPVLFIPDSEKIILPRCKGMHNLSGAERITKLIHLSGEDAIELIRAARMYQNGLWIAEMEPELSWLMIISAIETAAGHWRKQSGSPTERLMLSKPDLIPILNSAGGDALIAAVAEQIADFMGATKKFVEFIIHFKPEPPIDRPPEGFQISWDDKELTKGLRMIYNWRSKALHGGIPFPFPMCEVPYQLDNGRFGERPTGLSTRTPSASWQSKDTPMLLHTFEYLARCVLLNWWDSMAVKPKTEYP